MHRNPLGQLGNTGVWPFCAVLHWATAPGRTKRLASLVICISRFEAVPHTFLAIRDLTDVGISGALHTGLGFFGLLNAASATLPCGWGGHERRGPERQRFHVLHSIREGLGPLCYTGSLVSVRRATLDNPDSTACRFGSSLEQPRMARFSLTMLKSV